MVIPPLQPWMFKVGAYAAIVGVAFFGGCRIQRNIDAQKIQKLKANYERCVGIVDTFQDNVDTLDKAIQDQNEAITKQGEEYNRKVVALKASHDRATRNLNASYEESLTEANREAADLRRRMERMSVVDSCLEAMREIAQ